MTDAPVYAQTLGSGRPVLMLHGWGTSGSDLLPLAKLMTERARVHVVDLPGFGKSPRPASPWGTQDYARCVLDYMDAEKLDQVDIVAHSFGGRIALVLASEHAPRIRRLVLMAAAGIPPRRSFRRRAYLTLLGAFRTLLRLATPLLGPAPMNWFGDKFGSRDYKSAGPMRATFVRVLRDNLTSNLAQIRAPTLLLWGSLDSETPLEMAQRFKASIEQSQLVVLPNRGHFPHHDDGAQLCAYYINDFLRERGRRE